MPLNKDFLNTSDSLFLLEVATNNRFRNLDANQAFARLVGVPHEELVGAFIDDTVREELACQVTATCRRCLEAGSVVEETLELELPHGQQSFQFILLPLRDATGRMRQIFGVVSDLNTRQQTPERCLPLMNLALTHIRVSVFLISETAEFIFVNDAACRSLGYDRAELLGLTVADIDPDFPVKHWSGLWKKLTTKGSLHYESRHWTKNGRTFPVEVHANTFIFGGRGYAVALAHDMSDRHQALHALRESEDRFRFIIAHSPDTVSYQDRDLRYTMVFNPAFPLSPDSVIGRTDGDVLPADEAERLTAIKQRVLVSGERFQGELSGSYAGQPYCVETTIQPLHNQNGEVTGICTYGRDITKRKREEETLRQSEEKYRNLFEESFDGLFITSRSGAILDINRKGVDLFGYESKEEMRQLALATGVYAKPEDWPRVLTLVNDRDNAECEVEVKKKNGCRMMTRCSLTAIRDQLGTVAGYRGIIRDITTQKKEEEERQAHLIFLEGMDKVNRAMQGASDLEPMMSAVLDTVLDLFNCDRAFLMFPCDPESPIWLVPKERTRSEWPGVFARKMEVPMSPHVAESLRLLLAADGPLAFGPWAGQHPLPEDVGEGFGFKSFLSMAIYPMIGKPWQFGVHQCSHARAWTASDKRLLQEIGRRLSDALGSLLASRDLRESEAMYRSLVAAMAEGVVYQAADGAIIAVNPAAEKILGQTAAEMRGQTSSYLDYRTISEDGSPFPVERHPSMLTLRTGDPQTDVTMGIQKTSEVVTWISINSQPLITPGSSRPYAVVTTFHDLTERKQAEDLVRQREREFRTMAETMPANVARYDRDGRMIYINRSLAEFLGLNYEQTNSVPATIKVGNNSHWAAYRQTLGRVIATGEGAELELDMPDREAVHLVRFAPERDASGQIVGALTIGRDITEYKLTQNRLKKQADDLTEANSALKVLLQHSQQAETEIQKKCLANIEALVLPYLNQLGTLHLAPEGCACLDIIRKNLQGLALSSMSKLSAPVLGLTPREVVVADMIRKDHQSKEIAEFLCLSPGTIDFYRDQIRIKLGIKNRKVNLKNYLRSHFSD